MERRFDVFLYEEISQENFSFGSYMDDIGTVLSDGSSLGYEELIVKLEALPEFSLVPVSDIGEAQIGTKRRNIVPFLGFPFEKPVWKQMDCPFIYDPSEQIFSPRIKIELPDSVPLPSSIAESNDELYDNIHNFTPIVPIETNNSDLADFSSSEKAFGSQIETENFPSQREQEEAKRHTCEICGKSYRNICVKIRHMHSHSNIRPHICHVCHKSFLRKEYLTSHLRIHSGDRPYSCGICNKTFAYSSAKRSHMKLHKTKPFVCCICNRNFISADKLRLTTGTGTDIYTCERCHKKSEPAPEPSDSPTDSVDMNSLPQKSTLRNLKCDYCPRIYIRQSDLTKHVKTHLTNPLPAIATTPPQRNPQEYETDILAMISPKTESIFSCHLCSRSFNAKRLLLRHVYAHLGIKPFSCSICAKKYSRKEDLVLHNRTHTGEKPFSCDLCDKKFIRRRSFKLHRRTHNLGTLELVSDNVVNLGDPEN